LKRIGFLSGLCLLTIGILAPVSASAQACDTDQLDYGAILRQFRTLLDNFLVDEMGNNLWSEGANPLWMNIPGQLGPDFVDLDNDGNGIDDDDHLELLAAIVDGTAATTGALDPGEVAAIQAAFASNRAEITTLEVTIQNVMVDVTAFGFDLVFTRNATTGGQLSIDPRDDDILGGFLGGIVCGLTDCPIVVDIPSLWTQGQEEGLIASADPEIEQALLDLGAAVMTIGDPDQVTYFQDLVGTLTISLIEVLLPQLLSDVKSVEPFAPIEKISCAGLEDIIVVLDDVDLGGVTVNGDITVLADDICATINGFTDQFTCAGFSCQTDLLAANGDLNDDTTTNLASYGATLDRQSWMIAESLANVPLEVFTPNGIGLLGTPASLEVTVAGGSGPRDYDWELVNPLTNTITNVSATITLNDVQSTDNIDINGLTFIGTAAGTNIPNRAFNISGDDAADAAELASLLTNAIVGLENVSVAVAGNAITLTREPSGFVDVTDSSGTIVVVQTPFPRPPSQDTLDFNPVIALDEGFYAVQVCDDLWTRRSPTGFFETTDTDTIPPVITLVDGDVTVPCGDAFVDPGFTATDNLDGDITGNVNVGGAVDVNTPGAYVLTYNVMDAAGNAAIERTRTVTVEGPCPAEGEGEGVAEGEGEGVAEGEGEGIIIIEGAPEGEPEGSMEGEFEGAEEGEGAMEGQPEGADEGEVEGSPEGQPEGADEGEVEGSPEGSVEGAEEGEVEGSPEGSVEGAEEGEVEGSPEGSVEGAEEGEVEGSPEGAVEGAEEGEVEGSPEGAVEGAEEGEVEGSAEGEGAVEGSFEGEGQVLDAIHAADPDGNGSIELENLLRVIQFFNTLEGLSCAPAVKGVEGEVPPTDDGTPPTRREPK